MQVYSAFNATDTVSPNTPLSITASPVRTLGAIPCSIANIDGFVAAGTFPCYFQVFDAAVQPTTGAVPIISYYVAQAGPLPSYFATDGPVKIYQGLWFGCSSTGPTYTNSTNTYSVYGTVEDMEILIQDALSTAGDLSTGVDKRVVWVPGSGPKRLLWVDVINGIGAAATLMLFALPTANVVNGVTPIQRFPIANNTNTQSFRFGRDGRWVYSQDADYTSRVGCVVAVSTTVPTLTLPGSALNNIRAYFA